MKFLGALTNAVLATVWSGYVLSILWAWFVVTTFALPVLTIPAAIGVALVIRYITVDISEKDAEESTSSFKLIMCWVKPAVCLLTGWIVTLFM